MMRDHHQIESLEEASGAEEWPDESHALARHTVASRRVTRSELLARRALGFALDPTVSSAEAVAQLVELADGHATTLELARARILRAGPTGRAGQAAANALRHAFDQTGASAW
jgi:hypothetical protein